MDCNLPITAIPFLERFDDYVGGIAVDIEIIVFEDINACDYYELNPSPTPSITPTNTVTPTPTQTPGLSPSPTPTNTSTPTVTPSITPTNTTTPTQTVTPSITPSITPTSGECLLFELQAGGSGSNFTWINCDGTPGSIYLSGSSSTQLCGKNGTFSYDGAGSAAFIGPCPSPTPTPTNTTTPTVTSSVTPSITPTNTATPTVTPTNTATPTVTPTKTITPTPTCPCVSYNLTNGSISGTLTVRWTRCSDSAVIDEVMSPLQAFNRCSRTYPIRVAGVNSLDVFAAGACCP
jgi:hypothetical protein